MPQLILCSFLLLLLGCSHNPAAEPDYSGAPISPRPVSELPGDEDRFDSLKDQGFTHYARGDFGRAITQWEAAFLADPQASDLWPRFLLHYCYLSTGDYAQALSLGETLVRLSPYDPMAYQQLGLSYLWLGNLAQAQQNFQRALEFESHSPRVHFYQGLAFDRSKQPAQRDKSFAEAEKEYTRVLERNPDDFESSYELAALYLFQNKELEKAARLLATAKENAASFSEPELTAERKNFTNYYLALQEGILLSRKGDLRASTEALYRSLRQTPAGTKPDLAEIYFYLGKNRLGLGEAAGAKGLLQKSLAMDPHGPYAGEVKSAIRGIASRGSTSP